MSGVLIVDKPQDMTSAKVVALIKKWLHIKKAGHAGTLDPMATGVLVCCLNQATRLARFFLHGAKTYEAVLRLGIETDTQDASGGVVARHPVVGCSMERIEAVFREFEGLSEQMPPVYSALKHKGVSLYKLARQGRPVQKPARPVSIQKLEILAVAFPEIRFRVVCSGGTYIRSLCADIGQALGCGGHMHALKRIESSGFTLHEAVSLSRIKDLALNGRIKACIISMADALKQMPQVVAGTLLSEKIRHGRMIGNGEIDFDPTSPKAPPDRRFVKVVNLQNDLLAVLKYNPEERRFSYCCSFPNIN